MHCTTSSLSLSFSLKQRYSLHLYISNALEPVKKAVNKFYDIMISSLTLMLKEFYCFSCSVTGEMYVICTTHIRTL